MLKSGSFQKLTVARISNHGLYLVDEEENEVLLPNRYVSLSDKIGDQKEVFVYHDSEDRLVATTETPLAQVGQAAFLEAVDKTVHGAFMDWGLSAKHLFLPNRNMVGRVEPGQKYVVYVYRDNVTTRAVATMAFKGFISNENLTLKRSQQVDIIVTLHTESGFRVIINNAHWGMIYHNQIFSPVSIGDRMKAYVRRITEDNRVDLALQMEGLDEVKISAEKLLSIIKEAGGRIDLHDGSDPADINTLTGMSKKVFKRSAGWLMKREMIEMSDQGIKLK